MHTIIKLPFLKYVEVLYVTCRKIKKIKCTFFPVDISHHVHCRYIFVYKDIVCIYHQLQNVHTFPFFDVPGRIILGQIKLSKSKYTYKYFRFSMLCVCIRDCFCLILILRGRLYASTSPLLHNGIQGNRYTIR